jgi:hypothetical protein
MATKTEPQESTISTARKRDLDLILSQIVKEYGDGAIMRLGDSKQMDVEAIPTGNILSTAHSASVAFHGDASSRFSGRKARVKRR